MALELIRLASNIGLFRFIDLVIIYYIERHIFAIIMVRAESETQLALLNRISSALVSQRAVSMACLLSIGYVHVYLCISHVVLEMYLLQRFLVIVKG